MILTWFVASLHLVALGLGLSAIIARAVFLSRVRSAGDLAPALLADNLWGLAALVWIMTGVMRLIGGFDKATDYYLSSNAFWLKMALFALVLALEMRPMIALLRWRLADAQPPSFDASQFQRFARTSALQAVAIVVMVFAAAAMARGLWHG